MATRDNWPTDQRRTALPLDADRIESLFELLATLLKPPLAILSAFAASESVGAVPMNNPDQARYLDHEIARRFESQSRTGSLC